MYICLHMDVSVIVQHLAKVSDTSFANKITYQQTAFSGD